MAAQIGTVETELGASLESLYASRAVLSCPFILLISLTRSHS